MNTEYERAQPILEYFAKTYGMQVQVTDMTHLPLKKGWLAYALDFSSVKDNPFDAERIPPHERPWIIKAVWNDAEAYGAATKGYRWFWFIDPKDSPRDLTGELPITYI